MGCAAVYSKCEKHDRPRYLPRLTSELPSDSQPEFLSKIPSSSEGLESAEGLVSLVMWTGGFAQQVRQNPACNLRTTPLNPYPFHAHLYLHVLWSPRTAESVLGLGSLPYRGLMIYGISQTGGTTRLTRCFRGGTSLRLCKIPHRNLIEKTYDISFVESQIWLLILIPDFVWRCAPHPGLADIGAASGNFFRRVRAPMLNLLSFLNGFLQGSSNGSVRVLPKGVQGFRVHVPKWEFPKIGVP